MNKPIHMTIRGAQPTHGQLFFFLLIFQLATHSVASGADNNVLITDSEYRSSEYTLYSHRKCLYSHNRSFQCMQRT